MVRGKISTYRLRSDLLKEYLQSEFPNFKDFNVQVGALLFHRAECDEGADNHAQLSADGKEFYTFDTPEALTKVSLDVSCRQRLGGQGWPMANFAPIAETDGPHR
jgi:hypothetical protein